MRAAATGEERRLIHLHIGLARAGSSTIQRFLTVNADALAQSGIVAPDFRLMQVAVRALHGALDAPEVDALERLLSGAPGTTFLLSSEFLGSLRLMDAARIHRMREVTRAHEVRVLMMLRDYPSLSVSRYSQQCRTGRNADDFDTLLARGTASPVPLLAQWADAFGRDAVTVRSFGGLRGGSLTQDYATEAGVAHIPGVDLMPGDRANVSDGWVLIELARFLAADLRPAQDPASRRSFFKTVQSLGRRMGADEIGERAQYLTPAQWLDLRDRYNDDVAAINALLPGHALPTFAGEPPGERPFLPSLAEAPKPMLERLAQVARHPNFRRKRPELPVALLDRLAALADAPG